MASRKMVSKKSKKRKGADRRASGVKRVQDGAETAKAKGPHTAAQSLLSAEEELLWSYVVRSASPLPDKASGRVGSHDQGALDELGQGNKIADPLGRQSMRSRRLPLSTPSDANEVERQSQTSQAQNGYNNTGRGAVTRSQNGGAAVGPANFDRRSTRRIARGKIEIDARIDLHGLYQREAHGALRRFLFNAHAKGHRIVLVITGKGAMVRARQHLSSEYDVDHNDHAFEQDFGFIEEPGVLRRNVPLWLNEEDLCAIVAAYTPAHARHGGNGALYIHLRKRKTFKPR